MKLLLVEDDPSNVEMFRSVLPSASPSTQLTVAGNKEAALQAVANEFFDVIVLDLRIPPSDSDSVEDDAHGLATYEEIARILPGTPIILFTAFGTFELAGRLMEHVETKRVFGAEKHPMLDLVPKDRAQDCIDKIVCFASEIEELDKIEIEPGLQPIALDELERRVVKVSTKLLGGVRAEVGLIAGGFSGSRTMRFRVRTETGAIRLDALAKVGPIEKIDQEHQAYEEYVATCLAIGQFAHCIKKVTAGAGNKGGLFYALAGNFGEEPLSVFGLLSEDPAAAVRVVKGLQAVEDRWIRDTLPTPEKIRAARRLLISDEKLQSVSPRIYNMIQELEDRRIAVRLCPQHRDLHGLNILVNQDRTPLLIDYGEVGMAPAGLDAVILELSVITHERGREALQGWPSRSDVRVWADLEAYLATAPTDEIRAFIRECRQLAVHAAGGYNGVLVCAYAFAIRQIKYRDVDRIKIFRIVRSCIEQLVRS